MLHLDMVIAENLAEASAAASHYFKRLCKWDNVEDISGIKLFGFDLAPIEEEVSQIGLFETQGFEGMTMQLLCGHCTF